ncbi:MAG: amidohydrolase [Actinomycetota bacterium]|nr:amidohydrolase [Actinomycetota bacterium]MDH4353204.1 amidohydrolase [Actinomycetota bacterium]
MTTADAIFVGGRVFTGTGSPPVDGAVAVAGGRITAVGSEADVRALATSTTEVVQIDGGLLCPGFQDAHVHPVYGGTQMAQCDLHGVVTSEGSVAAVAAYAAAHPEAEWILGGGWSMEAFPGGTPTAALLDAVVPDRPVFLPNRDGHSGWVNAAALRAAGIDRSTPDPHDGRIERDAHGEPTGCLHEGAMVLVSDLVPGPTDEDYDRGLDIAQDYLFSLGITGWQDAIIGEVNGRPDNLDAYVRAARDGRLKARVVGALWWDRNRGAEQIPELIARREASGVGRFAATSVKVMQDGVAENFTAGMTAPYLDACGCKTANLGLSFVEPEALKGHVTALDAAGFQVHFHALGDRAVREALDAIEAARAANGMNDHRHHLAHLQVVHPDDVPRFAQLRAAANMQPLWACHEPQMDELTIPYLGEPRWRWQYPFGDLERAGATLVGGSDWSVSSPDVLWGAHVAATRMPPPDGEDHAGVDAFLPEQALSLASALTAYTRGSAWVNHLDDVTGTLEVGKLADLALLDRDPFAGPPDQIGATAVRRTYVEGELVFSG